jgi:hypothetical protein
MLAHDEVRERPPVLLQHADELHADTRMLALLDAHDLGMQMERVFAGKVEIELERIALIDRLCGAHEQAAARHILDQAIDDHPLDTAACPGTDRDTKSRPLVHVVKATLSTYVQKINSLWPNPGFTQRKSLVTVGPVAFVRLLVQIASPEKTGP